MTWTTIHYEASLSTTSVYMLVACTYSRYPTRSTYQLSCCVHVTKRSDRSLGYKDEKYGSDSKRNRSLARCAMRSRTRRKTLGNYLTEPKGKRKICLISIPVVVVSSLCSVVFTQCAQQTPRSESMLLRWAFQSVCMTNTSPTSRYVKKNLFLFYLFPLYYLLFYIIFFGKSCRSLLHA